MSEIPLTVLIPAFNEENRLEKCLCTLAQYFHRAGTGIELLVVDDGSLDATAEVARIAAQELTGVNFKLLQNPHNLGKGGSVRRGMLQARGRLTLVTDADLSTPVEEFSKLLSALREKQAQIAIGSRDLPESEVRVHQSGIRERSGKFYNLLVRAGFGLPFRDTQCGFKLFQTEPCRTLFENQSVARYSYDVEILLLARLRGLRVVEVPVVWRHDRGSRVHFLKDGSRMILDLGRIAWKYWTGAYQRALVRAAQEEKK